jgi:hypothetical protein
LFNKPLRFLRSRCPGNKFFVVAVAEKHNVPLLYTIACPLVSSGNLFLARDVAEVAVG